MVRLDSNEEIKDILKEILKWTKFKGLQELKAVLETALDDDTKKLIYNFSDGSDSKQVASQVHVSDWTVRNYRKKWAILGIMEPYPKFKGRYWKLFTLEEVGIEIPENRTKVNPLQEGEEEKTQAGVGNGSKTI
jgi:hypothetical protein